MPKTKTPSVATTRRLTIIRSLVDARKAMLALAVDTEDTQKREELGRMEETLGEVLAAIRKPLQPTPHTHGPLPQE